VEQNLKLSVETIENKYHCIVLANVNVTCFETCYFVMHLLQNLHKA